MLELLEIFDGLFLFFLYIALTVFLPVALVGLFIGFVAIVARTIIALLGSSLGALGRIATPAGPVARFMRVVLLGVIPWAIGLVAILYLLSFAGSALGGTTFAGTVGGGVRVTVEALARLQDGSMRLWTAHTLTEVIAVTGQAADLHALAAFTALVAERLFTTLGPDLSLLAFRWVFAIGLGALILVGLGLTPFRALAGLRIPALPAVRLPESPLERPRSVARPPLRAASPPVPVAAGPRLPRASGGSRVAIVSPRGDLSRDLMHLVRACGSSAALHYSTLEEYEATPQALAVILDAHLLRWSAGSPTTNAHRLRTILAYAATDDPPDAEGFAGLIRSDAPALGLRSILARLATAA